MTAEQIFAGVVWLAVALCVFRHWVNVGRNYEAAENWALWGWILIWPGMIALAVASAPPNPL